MFSTRLVVFVLAIALVGHLATESLAQTRPQTRPQGPVAQGPSRAQPRGPVSQTGQRVARQQPAPTRQNAGPPKGFDLAPAEQAVVTKMLDFWEQKTANINTFTCEFGRWVYDPVFGPKNNAASFTTGQIRYAAPDRGMIQEKDVFKFNAKMQKAGAKWPFEQQKGVIGEHWVCDGKSVFEFNHKTKELVQTILPPEMQGKAIAEGPLPFMFGAKAATIKERYWIRQLARDETKKEPYHLEFIPRGRGADFSRVRIKLDEANFLPVEMVLYDLNLQGRSAYVFKELQVNGASNGVKNFLGSFVSPKTPRGWKKIVHDVSRPAPGPAQQSQQPRQAQGPSQPKR